MITLNSTDLTTYLNEQEQCVFPYVWPVVFIMIMNRLHCEGRMLKWAHASLKQSLDLFLFQQWKQLLLVMKTGAQPWYRYWGVQIWALHQIFFFLSSVADQIVKTNRPGHQWMKRLINGVGSAGTPWSVTPAVHYSAYFQGIMLAT